MDTCPTIITLADLDARLAELAAIDLRDAATRARMLTTLAETLEAARASILTTASNETALTIDELTPEFTRMTATLRLFAERTQDPATFRAQVDGAGTPAIGPAHSLQSRLVPLGLVAVFGASNFPLAYGVCGGDTASALAAGCPVVVKEHLAHPKTGQLLAALASDAGAPLLYLRDSEPHNAAATALIQHPVTRAIGFTGSTAGGLAIDELARKRVHALGYPDPIPVFAEMGSCNVIVTRARAFASRFDQITRDLANSLLTRHGQQCTAPGVIVCEEVDETSANTTKFYDAFARLIAAAPPRRLLSPRVASGFFASLDEVAALPGITHTSRATTVQRDSHFTPAVALHAPWSTMCHAPAWQEMFGPAVIVTGDTLRRVLANPRLFPPSLTATLIADEADHDELWPELVARASAAAGRVVFNGVPTGVRVADAMNHTGPHPACNAPHTTAVGPRAIERWCRPVTFQNAPTGIVP
ncbi:MAG TPA: aldehyde dehydrogenase family protein [Phycisphaerales bacterium]|nr:aldehyde dehydrogenase family protein [Phycisphaerales bacterium]